MHRNAVVSVVETDTLLQYQGLMKYVDAENKHV